MSDRVTDLINYICQVDFNKYPFIHDKYSDLAPYRNYLALLLTGNKATIGKKVFINSRIINGKYVMAPDYYLTEVETIKFLPETVLYFKFVSIALTSGSSHSTLLILDKSENKAYYIDPNGYPSWYPEALRVVMEYINYHAKSYNLSFELQSCFTGPQAISYDDFCANWTLLLLYLKVNSDKSIDEILHSLVKYDRIILNKLMENWTCYLWSLVEQLHLIEINNYLNLSIHKMSPENYRYLSDFVDNMIKNGTPTIALNLLKFEYSK